MMRKVKELVKRGIIQRSQLVHEDRIIRTIVELRPRSPILRGILSNLAIFSVVF